MHSHVHVYVPHLYMVQQDQGNSSRCPRRNVTLPSHASLLCSAVSSRSARGCRAWFAVATRPIHEAGPWHTFLKLTVDECKEHPVYCPLVPGKPVEGITIHPPLNPLTPGGWYRSRQLYSDADTKERFGCVDMTFRYEFFPSGDCGKSPTPHNHTGGFQCGRCGHVYNAQALGKVRHLKTCPILGSALCVVHRKAHTRRLWWLARKCGSMTMTL
ncbi:unnamed protein product [Polarella glacialis]|uniref:Uncharacterized protein n=1 Tax=Polarella glacialis TaxID=89957 RepID=A0A813LTP5_POLGL|nr:unnamed protein product [Polarella glacialis]